MLELNHDAVLKLLPDRPLCAHKGDFGRVLLLCGSRGYTGAAALAAMGALRSGAGLVYLGVPESIYAIEAIKLTEPIVFPLPDKDGTYAEEAAQEVIKMLPKMDAVLIGCGMGQAEGTKKILETVLREAKCPVVVDADGINILAAHKVMLRGRSAPTILTPHEGEFCRLDCQTYQTREEAAKNLSMNMGCITLLKGHRTMITDGYRTYCNPTGNPGMAVGGSGDLLAGMIVSLLAQGLSPLEAAAVGAWLHGAAGDLCARQIGQYGMLPSDMLQVLPRLMK
jgi:NAD(P)H-hydrate epimerase